MDGHCTHKVRLVVGGDTTDPPLAIICLSVVTQYSMIIAFLVATLNDLDISAADVGNAYLYSPWR